MAALEFVGNAANQPDIVFLASEGGFVVIDILQGDAKAHPLGKIGFDSQFKIQQEVGQIVDLGQPFQRLPQTRPFSDCRLKPLSNAQRNVTVLTPAKFVVHE